MYANEQKLRKDPLRHFASPVLARPSQDEASSSWKWKRNKLSPNISELPTRREKIN